MDNTVFKFSDRTQAGVLLAERLSEMGLERPLVYALPRGGVPVAVEVARKLNAPLDLILVRKIGAPGNPEVALGAIVEGANVEVVINEDIRRFSGADTDYLERAYSEQLAELERRKIQYLSDRSRLDPRGRTVVVVDDGLATGATMKAALIALKRNKAARIVVALPVAPTEALEELADSADDIVCLHPATEFRGVGGFFRDFHQLSDEETTTLLNQRWSVEDTETPLTETGNLGTRQVEIPPLGLVGDLVVPENPSGIVIFAHGSGSSRHSPRNKYVASKLNEKGFATLLFDLLTPAEGRDRRYIFDIPLLADRVVQACMWVGSVPDIADLPLGIFGASTGAGAALVAAGELKGRVAAVVSRGGRPDLAGEALADVLAPTLLIVGSLDGEVINLNETALAAIRYEKKLQIVSGAGHLFEESGTLDVAIAHAAKWFEQHLVSLETPPVQPSVAIPNIAVLRAAAEPLPAINDPEFAKAFDRFGSHRVVLLGEASHGTSEFYQARAAITRRLIEEHGFSSVAVEADWPDAAAINHHTRQSPHRPMKTPPFSRFPTWMWRNEEFRDFTDFLRQHNDRKTQTDQVGFYGLDIYNMNASIAAVLAYLDRVDPLAADVARKRYACLSPWSHEPAAYGRAALTHGFAICETPVTNILVDLLRKELEYTQQDGDQFFDATQNARLVAKAERYYRAMYYGSHVSWNLRDQHMFDTLKQILDHAGPDEKIVVWAHNSHIGDARFTDMGRSRDELNIGQLCREEFGDEAALIGFGTASGTVAAASEWDAPMEIKAVRPPRPDSYEALCHDVGLERFLFDFRKTSNEALRRAVAPSRLERYIGVIYRPESERASHYSPANLADQYDAFVWFDKTNAVTALPTSVAKGEDETYPFGL
jgi:erythromycin esterase-like protein/predicted phosphoribosyltransferase/predicted alpha/beta-hydrolase family hydrolase